MTTGVNNTKAVVDIDEKILSAIFIETASSTCNAGIKHYYTEDDDGMCIFEENTNWFLWLAFQLIRHLKMYNK